MESRAPDFQTFARILAPGHISSTKSNGSPAPYPSFKSYLDSLNVNYKFTDSGQANGSNFSYSGSIASDGKNGYFITLSGTTTPPPSPLPADSTITIKLPNRNTAPVQQGINFDSFIYGAVLRYDSIGLSG